MKGAPYDFETKTLKKVAKPSDYPAGRCFVIQFFEEHSVHHEGDERSRTCPGHGYPAYTETFTAVTTFVTLDEVEWRDKLAEAYQAHRNRTDVAAFTMERATVKPTVQVMVDRP